MDDQNTPGEPVVEVPAQASEPVPTTVEPEPVQPTSSEPTEMPPAAPELPIDAPAPIPVEDQNGGVNQPSPVQPVPVPAPAQQDQGGFIHALLAKANAKLGLNRQKKLDKLMLLAQKKGFVTNEDAQDLLHCSDATATRYLAKSVEQGRLAKTDGSHWVKYRFVR